MGQRRELRRPAGTRKMLADKRREVTRLKREIKSMTGDLLHARDQGNLLAHRFRVLIGIGRFLLVKDLWKRVK